MKPFSKRFQAEENFTLSMALLVAPPVSVVYFSLQRYVVGGLTIGGVKG